ncbi:MAG: triose-phosphate isomerase [Deltaproteobacteria bacterium]|jgi:triosephosphate isomerase|nr:triose-phosphate isomerase [Deltaproteobacteria bacterium]MDA8304692.1 triose-phosphate isomerase [Deltaproteobacteria bacterium]
MKKNIIAANFKMNKTNKDIEGYFDIFARNINELKNKSSFAGTEIVFAPPFTSLCEAYRIIKPFESFIKLSSQNIYYEQSGAYTGEISLDMIKNCGCVYAIVGHSERRNIFGESDELVANKVSAVYNNGGIIPILCVGENLEIRNKNGQEKFVENQLNIALNSIKGKNITSLIIAYEPIWAIGTGIPIKPDDGEAMHRFIYDYIKSNFLIDELRIIYGGSVTESNISALMIEPHIDGVLVGGASLDPAAFFNIVKLSIV